MYLTIYISFVSSKCREDQKSLLLQFKNKLTFDPESSGIVKSWNQSIGCCDWEGVTCDEDGQVIGLELIYESISGGLDNSSTLFSLQHLSYISLDGNNLSSTVPEAFANFKNLEVLSLADCNLIGMFPEKIFQMPTLSLIDISGNSNLQGSFPEFPLNGSLQTLSVSFTNFSGELTNSICNLKNLTYLNLRSNNFSGSILPLGMCKKLQNIYLSRNSFTGAISSANYEDLVNLDEIDLGNNYFSGMIPSSLFMLPSLRSVTLSNNKFYGQLNDFINASSTIELIDLSGNHLEGPIPISLLQLTNLTHLILSFNMFSGTIELNILSRLRNLVTLDISHNNLTIIDASTSLTPFPLFPHLSLVGFASCKLKTFPQFLKNLSYPVDIDLSNNHIAGTIPQWIWNSSSLQVINLSHNYLDNWEEPMWINIFEVSIIVDVHSNLLQGPLPTIPQSTFYVDFSNNNFSSIIPESICDATRLEVLDLSNNYLTGTIPKCLIAMNGTLSILDLGRNKLNGTIDTFPGLCSLRTLHLNGNSLQGKLPKYLANCGMLEILDIGDNQIHDKFPCWLKNISSLRVLILHSNKFYGSLKCGGTKVAWPHLQIFGLASNNFGGELPMSFFETWKATMTHENDRINKSKLGPLEFQVQVYDEADEMNRLTTLEPSNIYYQGKVTVTSKQQQMELVKILTIHTVIDLSSNKFQGLIPKEFGLLNALHILNLSHNAFLGPIPSSLGNMKDLESLDLSYNCLSGNIPTQITNLSFLSVLNLSFNHLVGRIPTGTQIQSFPPNSFKGNDGRSGDGVQERVSPASISNVDTKNSIELNFISVELGFDFGIGIIVLPLVFYKSGRIRYWKCVDNILYHIFPHLDFVYERCGEQNYRSLRWKPY
ncbi:hypothetical protein VNO77_07537 [Canavalia gladiata]|uniref:Leucine-rich repeat-containing N-terminal plant-type domain-containing protein n=1 Tax=Canavalia gladiata TaxID=3824 RepID=A0AAN9R0M8_CANGL